MNLCFNVLIIACACAGFYCDNTNEKKITKDHLSNAQRVETLAEVSQEESSVKALPLHDHQNSLDSGCTASNDVPAQTPRSSSEESINRATSQIASSHSQHVASDKTQADGDLSAQELSASEIIPSEVSSTVSADSVKVDRIIVQPDGQAVVGDAAQFQSYSASVQLDSDATLRASPDVKEQDSFVKLDDGKQTTSHTPSVDIPTAEHILPAERIIDETLPYSDNSSLPPTAEASFEKVADGQENFSQKSLADTNTLETVASKVELSAQPDSMDLKLQDLDKTVDQDKGSEDFPSFAELRKKVLEEEEMESLKVKQSSGGSGIVGDGIQSSAGVNSQKLRMNFAAKVCGAKVIASNPEMENAHHMLSPNKDEYMINPCSAKKWFVVELCEPVMVKMVEMTSLELFSSQSRTIRVAVSDRYPTKDWLGTGTYELTADRVPQAFSLTGHNLPYVKFIRVEIMDHHGKEHYCPVTHFRVFGIPMEDDDNEGAAQHTHAEDDEMVEENGETKTLFSRTKDTVINLVKKVLYKDDGQTQLEGPNAESGEKEKGANFSEDEVVPCAVKDGSHITVGDSTQHILIHPTPTSPINSASSTYRGEIPMVTMLDDSEQIENEPPPGKVTADGRYIVTLLQSGDYSAWSIMAHVCSERLEPQPFHCPYNPLCAYMQLMFGTPPPVSHHPPSSFAVISTSTSQESWVSTKLDSFLITSCSVSKALETLSDKLSTHIKPTMPLPDVQPTSLPDIMQDFDTSLPLKPEKSIIDKVGPKGEITHDEDLLKGGLKEAEIKVDQNAGKKMDFLETTENADHANPSDSLPLGDSITPSASELETLSQSTTLGTEQTLQSVLDKGQVEEILQPSIQLEITSVVPSDLLSRPTPVLEESRASIDTKGAKPPVQETSVPPVSPTPTSDSVLEVVAEETRSMFPQAVEPTVQIPESEAIPDRPQELLSSSQVGVDTNSAESATLDASSDDKINRTEFQEKSKGDLDLEHIPLTFNAKRESAIMRLTNRIKALELNVSLSSRYLDELMQVLKKTISRLNATNIQAQDQNKQQDVKIDRLETRLENLEGKFESFSQQNKQHNVIIEQLETRLENLEEKLESFSQHMSDRQMVSTTVNIVLLLLAVLMCLRFGKSTQIHPDIQFLLDTMPRRPPPPSTLPRRNSDAVISPQPLVGGIVRRTGSDNALTFSLENSVLPNNTADFIQHRYAMVKKKKRKKSRAQKASSFDLDNLQSKMRCDVTTSAGVLFGTESSRSEMEWAFVDRGGGTSVFDSDHSETKSDKSFGHHQWGSSNHATGSAQEPARNPTQYLLGGSEIVQPLAKRLSVNPPIPLPPPPVLPSSSLGHDQIIKSTSAKSAPPSQCQKNKLLLARSSVPEVTGNVKYRNGIDSNRSSLHDLDVFDSNESSLHPGDCQDIGNGVSCNSNGSCNASKGASFLCFKKPLSNFKLVSSAPLTASTSSAYSGTTDLMNPQHSAKPKKSPEQMSVINGDHKVIGGSSDSVQISSQRRGSLKAVFRNENSRSDGSKAKDSKSGSYFKRIGSSSK